MSNLIRRYKIHQITHILTKHELEIVNFVKHKVNNLTEFKYYESPNSIFYMNNQGECILKQNHKNEWFCVRYQDFWKVLETKYKLENSDIQLLIYYIGEQVFNRKLHTPPNYLDPMIHRVEQAFKRSIK